MMKVKTMLRRRKTKIVATLGPASATYDDIKALHMAGADVFRLNFSHGTHGSHQEIYNHLRTIESEIGMPLTIIADLQGPKLRIGTFKTDAVQLSPGALFTFDQNPQLGDQFRVCLPHPEVFDALKGQVNESLLLDDGKLRVKVLSVTPDHIKTIVLVGGDLSHRKGVNVPGVTLPISALTEKDHQDLVFALNLGVDWIAVSFVQTAENMIEARNLIGERAKLIAKIEKPKALENLTEILEVSDAIMVARGDLGVEMNPEEVPSAQKKIIRECREKGKPVIVATQMLDSMVHMPVPTRAEASDVANAVYEGADAVMLSAESASGDFPVEAVSMMNRIIEKVELDTLYYATLHTPQLSLGCTVSDALTVASRQVAEMISVKAIMTFTETGNSTLAKTRERPKATIVGLTPRRSVARMMGLFWGTHSVVIDPIHSFSEMVSTACRMALEQKVVVPGDRVIILAGIPFGERSGTNIMQITDIF
jgi:pyruvate kinase